MDIYFFLQVVSATFLGVILAAVFLWAVWSIVRLERQGATEREIPFRLLLAVLLPLVFAALAVSQLS